MSEPQEDTVIEWMPLGHVAIEWLPYEDVASEMVVSNREQIIRYIAKGRYEYIYHLDALAHFGEEAKALLQTWLVLCVNGKPVQYPEMNGK